jgi:hypothetical protein
MHHSHPWADIFQPRLPVSAVTTSKSAFIKEHVGIAQIRLHVGEKVDTKMR